MPADRVVRLAERLMEAGCDEVGLSDTTGYANPAQVKDLVKRVRAAVEAVQQRVQRFRVELRAPEPARCDVGERRDPSHARDGHGPARGRARGPRGRAAGRTTRPRPGARRR